MLPFVKASPLTADTPILIPVKEPGPTLTAKASMSQISICACLNTSLITGISVALWVSFVFEYTSLKRNSFLKTAALTLTADVSIASKFKSVTPVNIKNSFVFFFGFRDVNSYNVVIKIRFNIFTPLNYNGISFIKIIKITCGI